jgi:hypothetical protein
MAMAAATARMAMVALRLATPQLQVRMEWSSVECDGVEWNGVKWNGVEWIGAIMPHRSTFPLSNV